MAASFTTLVVLLPFIFSVTKHTPFFWPNQKMCFFFCRQMWAHYQLHKILCCR
jgi:hypothetical protein